MADIYQQIWDADQRGNGVRPFYDDQPVRSEDRAAGFVTINSRLNHDRPEDLRVLPEVVIPAAKSSTYDFCKRLFGNYALDEQAAEVETEEEREETHDFVQAIVDTPPMLVARAYVEQQTGTTISRDRWYSTIHELWFRRFKQSGDPDLTGFEHVLVGEQQGSVAQGYHFWWKYYLDDGFASQVDGARERLPGFKDDRIVYIQSKASAGQQAFPETVTISYRWSAPDYEAGALRPLVKKTGGFFVGCSPEGLMALGTVRAHIGANAPKQAVINGARYELMVFRSDDDKNIRTFYPMFKGAAGAEPPRPDLPPPDRVVSGQVRIVAAMVNPLGDDVGKELVVLVNMGSANLSLAGWRLVDKNNNQLTLQDVTLPGGSSTTVKLPKNTAQLANQGGEIKLFNPAGELVHRVAYSKQQAQREGETQLF
jgi:poly(U)-specific endoribonuclease